MAICRFCGEEFIKEYNAEVYCDECKAEATRENNRERFRRHYNKYKGVPTFTKYKKSLGTGSLREHKCDDFNEEMNFIQNEKERLKLI
nr:hypothetical protein [Methanobrevibacter arboriphilus]